jgi:hypothetical protein
MKAFLLPISFLILINYSCDNYDDISTIQSDSFIKNYTLNQMNTGTGVCKLSDGGYALLGYTETLTRETDICLIITDAFGNSIQQAKLYGGRKSDRGYCIKQMPDGGFAILGSRQHEERGDLDIYLIRTDRLGDTLWTRTFGGEDSDDEGLCFDTDENGNIMMVGYTFGSEKKTWHFLVDQNGDLIDAYIPKPYGIGSNNEARFVKRVKDEWLITGVMYIPQLTPIWRITSDYRLLPIILDSIITDEEANALTVLDDNNYLVCGTEPDGTGGSKVLVYRIRKTLEDEHTIRYIREKEEIYKFNPTNNNKGTSILTRNNQIHILSTLTYNDKTSMISVITTNLQGENPEYRSFGGSSLMESRNFEFTEDEGFIISGTNKRDYKSSLVMIKTKAGGQL